MGKVMDEAERLVNLAWNVFCRKFPQAVESKSAEDLEYYRKVWKVGYYFSLNPMFKPIKQKIEENARSMGLTF